MMRAGLRRPFTRLSDALRSGTVGIGDLKYLLPGEVTDDFLPPDGRTVYQDAYPGLKDVLKEYLEGDTLNWVQDAGVSLVGVGNPLQMNQSLAIGADGILYMLNRSTGTGRVFRYAVAANGALTPLPEMILNWNTGENYSCVACGKYIVFGSTYGRIILYDTETGTQVAEEAVLNGQSQGMIFGVFDSRYVLALPHDNTHFNGVLIDTQSNYRSNVILSDGSSIRITDVKSCGPFLVYTTVDAGNSSSRIGTFAKSAAANPTVSKAGVQTLSSGSTTRAYIFCVAAQNKVFLTRGDGSSAGNLDMYALNPATGSLDGAVYVGKVSLSTFEQFAYDEPSDTLIQRASSNGTNYFLRRARGKLSKMLTGTLLASDFENVDTPSRSSRSTASILVDNGRWFAIGRDANNLGVVPIRAGPDANARRRHVLPLITTGNSERLDGRTPYMRVK